MAQEKLLRFGFLTTVLLFVGACNDSSRGPLPPPVSESPAEPADDEPTSEDDPEEIPVLAPLLAYVEDGPYADVLSECTSPDGLSSFCSLESLPYIGQDTDDPTLGDVLDRLVVSDSWMGDNFAALLGQMPDDVLPMFRSVRAVVITRDMSQGRFLSGNIHLDPASLWLDSAELSVLSPNRLDEDPGAGEFERTPSESALGFRVPHRYVRDGSPLEVPLSESGTRAVPDLLPLFGMHVYHMLAHAVDQMAPVELATLVPEDYLFWGPFYLGPYLSDDWSDAYPMHAGVEFENLLLHGLAQKRFDGGTPTPHQLAVQPESAVLHFVDEGAVRFFSYLSRTEDFAVAFETAMMGFHFGYEAEVAITDNEAPDVDDALVIWGQRGRIGGQQVYVRVLAAVQAIYPGDLSAVEAFLASRPPPTPLPTFVSWSETLN